jgi:hypothetical protein
MNLLTETPLFQMLTQERVLDTLRNSLLRQLERRLGPVPDDLRQQLQQITDPERLEQLLDAAVDSDSLDDFRSHL